MVLSSIKGKILCQYSGSDLPGLSQALMSLITLSEPYLTITVFIELIKSTTTLLKCSCFSPHLELSLMRADTLSNLLCILYHIVDIQFLFLLKKN